MTLPPLARRLPWLMLGVIALLAGMWAGLLRIGWIFPAGPVPVMEHGPLMLCGFFGTVLSLERAVAISRPWAYGAPLCAGLGGLTLLMGGPVWVAAALFVIAGVVMLSAALYVLEIDRSLHLGVMALGALSWLAGNVAFAFGVPIPQVVPAWAGFLILTIVGERLELNRLMRPRKFSRVSFLAGTSVVVIGILLSIFVRDAGMRVFGVGLLSLALWLGTYDLARRTIKLTGLPRFIAVTLLGGYFWLAVGGVLGILFGNPFAGPHYDAVLHAFFVGFVFSAIFAHAPVIIPAVLRIQVQWRPSQYAPVALLQLSLLARVAGDLTGGFGVRRAGGLLNVVAILLFIGLSAASVRRRRSAPTEIALPSKPAANEA